MSEKRSREDYVKEFFGRSRRVDVWAAVMQFAVEPPEPFYSQQLEIELASTKDIPPSSTHKEISFLRRWGMIDYLPYDEYPVADPKRTYYRRTNSPAWEIAETAVRVADALFPRET